MQGPVRPMPMDNRSGAPYSGHGPIPAQISLLGPAPFGQPQQHMPQRPREPVDEYAGLMSMKDRTWLVNIQLSQLFTPNPYIDDYYYTVSYEKLFHVLESMSVSFANVLFSPADERVEEKQNSV